MLHQEPRSRGLGLPAQNTMTMVLHRWQYGTTGSKAILADIEAGKVDCVVVYKVDRLSRSLMDFAKMLVERLRTKASRLRQRYAGSIRPTPWDG